MGANRSIGKIYLYLAAALPNGLFFYYYLCSSLVLFKVSLEIPQILGNRLEGYDPAAAWHPIRSNASIESDISPNIHNCLADRC